MGRREALQQLRCPIMGRGSDDDIAADTETPVAIVRALRQKLRRDLITLEVLGEAELVAEQLGWEGELDELILRALKALSADG